MCAEQVKPEPSGSSASPEGSTPPNPDGDANKYQLNVNGGKNITVEGTKIVTKP